MKNNARLKIHDVFSILKKKDFLYLFISLILFNVYAIIDSSPNAKIFENLIYSYNDYYYVGLLMLLTLIFSLIVLSRYKNRVEISTRFKNKKEFFLYIFKKIMLMITFIYLVNFAIVFLMRTFKDFFVFENKIYYLYNVPVSVYFLWSFFKVYIYLIYISYLVVYINFYYNKKILTNLTIVLSIVTILIPVDAFINNTSIGLLFVSSFFRYKDYYSIFNEILYFFCSIVVKVYLLSFLFYLVKSLKKYENIKYLFYRTVNNFKVIILPLCVYLVINVINFALAEKQSDVNYLEFLSIGNIRDLSYVNLATKAISILCLIYIVAKLVYKELKLNSSILFTRISQKNWFISKKIIYSFLFLILRLPIYIYLKFSIFCIYDIFVYLYLLFIIFDYLKENNNFNLYSFLIMTMITLIIKVDANCVIILFVVYLLKYLIQSVMFNHKVICK